MKALLKIAGNSYPGYSPPKQAPDSRKINQAAQGKNLNKLNELAKDKPKVPSVPKIASLLGKLKKNIANLEKHRKKTDAYLAGKGPNPYLRKK